MADEVETFFGIEVFDATFLLIFDATFFYFFDATFFKSGKSVKSGKSGKSGKSVKNETFLILPTHKYGYASLRVQSSACGFSRVYQ